MSQPSDVAYETDSPKRSDWAPPPTCVICYGVGGHYGDCVEATC